MKILHALVAYLAVTAHQPAPFHLFSFASPLAATIDYDGFVNTTQSHIDHDGAVMKHLLGSIMETCHTTTHHSDGALMRRVPGDIIEARQAENIAVPPIVTVIVIVAAVILSIPWITDHDDKVRDNGVESLEERFDKKFSARDVRRLPKVLSARSFRSIQNSTGLFAIPPIPSGLMGLRARTGVTHIMN